ncbi:MAG: FAD-dependent monooxygenase [Rhodospirillales bacterium]|nr:FAD-dependent monooxygenase [Rhodospirillales bacterium]
MAIKTRVLIVGGGPVGLGLALELGRLGTECILAEQSDGVVKQPKLGLVSTRTMEFCRRWGTAQEIRDVYPPDFPATQLFVTSLCGYELSRQEYPTFSELPPLETSPERHQRCTQIYLEPILRRAAEAHPSATIRLNTRMTSFHQDENGVMANCEDVNSGEVITIEADYMVGCDGAASIVRGALGIEMEGKLLSHSINVFFKIPELWSHHDKGKAERYLLIGKDGTWGNFTAIDGRELWRLSIAGDENQADMDEFDADAALARGFGTDDLDYEILSVMPWTRLQMVAKSYRRNRVFLAGDAVHCFSPTGGFGGNTGVSDAFNLSWKLAAVLEGWGGPKLLDSYEHERRPIAFRNTGEAAKNFRRQMSAGENPNLLDDTDEGRRQRAEVGELVRSETQNEWETLGVQLGYRYEASPIDIADGTEATPDEFRTYLPSARPGSRAPHAWLAEGHSTLDEFGDGFTLLRFDQSHSIDGLQSAAKDNNVPLKCVDVKDEKIGALYEARFAIIRPDGHVTWRGDALPDDCENLIGKISGFGV